ncbi:MAG: amino acid ABC transporter permease [Oscillospiraceae bacterium]|nr:amino acid ABC transporter permease [Oscillospiraceae bacterium]
MSFSTINSELFVGFFENVKLFGVTLLFALPLGLIIAFGSMSKFSPVKLVTRAFVWIIRGTPLMLQLFVVFYVPGLVFNKQIPGNDPRMTAAAIAFIINYACYFSEIYRGGIESIPKGQYEAGQVLGMTKTQTFFKVVLLQVIKRIVPPMSNEFMTLIKDTSLERVIAVMDLIMVADSFSARGVIWPLFYTALFFLVFCGLMTVIFGRIEKRLDYFKA